MAIAQLPAGQQLQINAAEELEQLLLTAAGSRCDRIESSSAAAAMNVDAAFAC